MQMYTARRDAHLVSQSRLVNHSVLSSDRSSPLVGPQTSLFRNHKALSAFRLAQKAPGGKRSAVQNVHSVWFPAELTSIDPKISRDCDYWSHQRQTRLSKKAIALLQYRAVGIPAELLNKHEARSTYYPGTSILHAEFGNGEESAGSRCS